MAEQNLEQASKDIGLIYLSKTGYVKVTDNMTEVPSDWFARFYWTKTGICGDHYLTNENGRHLHMDLNSNLDSTQMKGYVETIRSEINGIEQIKDLVGKALPELETALAELDQGTAKSLTPKDVGMIYLSKKGYVKVIDDLTQVPSDWIARLYLTGNNGSTKPHLDLNPNLDSVYARKYMVSLRFEINDLEQTKDVITKVLPELESIVQKKEKSAFRLFN